MDETSTNYVPQLGIMPTWDGFKHVNRPAISLDWRFFQLSYFFSDPFTVLENTSDTAHQGPLWM
jgi:hypothetical protein